MQHDDERRKETRREAGRLDAERLEADRLMAQREEERELITRAKAVEAERKHQAEVAWAKRVLSEEGDAGFRTSRQLIPKAIRHSVWQRDIGRCVECGSREDLEFDHIIPIAMGGATAERNLQLLCGACNRRKGKSLG